MYRRVSRISIWTLEDGTTRCVHRWRELGGGDKTCGSPGGCYCSIFLDKGTDLLLFDTGATDWFISLSCLRVGLLLDVY